MSSKRTSRSLFGLDGRRRGTSIAAAALSVALIAPFVSPIAAPQFAATAQAQDAAAPTGPGINADGIYTHLVDTQVLDYTGSTPAPLPGTIESTGSPTNQGVIAGSVIFQRWGNLAVNNETGNPRAIPLQGVRVYAQWMEANGAVSPIYTTTTNADGSYALDMKPFTAGAKTYTFHSEPSIGARSDETRGEKFRIWAINPDDGSFVQLKAPGNSVFFPNAYAIDTTASMGMSNSQRRISNATIAFTEKIDNSVMHLTDETGEVKADANPVDPRNGGRVTGTVFWNQSKANGNLVWGGYNDIGGNDTRQPNVRVYGSYLSDYAIARIYGKTTDDKGRPFPGIDQNNPPEAFKSSSGREARTPVGAWTAEDEAELQNWIKQQIAKEGKELWIAETATALTGSDGEFQLQFKGTYGNAWDNAGLDTTVGSNRFNPGANNSGLRHAAGSIEYVLDEDGNQIIDPSTGRPQIQYTFFHKVAESPQAGVWENTGIPEGNEAKHVNLDWVFISTEEIPGAGLTSPFSMNYYGVHRWATGNDSTAGWNGLAFASAADLISGFNVGIVAGELGFNVVNFDLLNNPAGPGDVAHTTAFNIPSSLIEDAKYTVVWENEKGDKVKTCNGLRPSAVGTLPTCDLEVPEVLDEETIFVAKLYAEDAEGELSDQPLAADSFRAVPDPTDDDGDGINAGDPDDDNDGNVDEGYEVPEGVAWQRITHGVKITNVPEGSALEEKLDEAGIVQSDGQPGGAELEALAEGLDKVVVKLTRKDFVQGVDADGNPVTIDGVPVDQNGVPEYFLSGDGQTWVGRGPVVQNFKLADLPFGDYTVEVQGLKDGKDKDGNDVQFLTLKDDFGGNRIILDAPAGLSNGDTLTLNGSTPNQFVVFQVEQLTDLWDANTPRVVNGVVGTEVKSNPITFDDLSTKDVTETKPFGEVPLAAENPFVIAPTAEGAVVPTGVTPTVADGVVTLPADTPEGNYKIPVVVTYKDGTTDTVLVPINVMSETAPTIGAEDGTMPDITGRVGEALPETIIPVNPGTATIDADSIKIPALDDAGLTYTYDADKGGIVVTGTPTKEVPAGSTYTVELSYQPSTGGEAQTVTSEEGNVTIAPEWNKDTYQPVYTPGEGLTNQDITIAAPSFGDKTKPENTKFAKSTEAVPAGKTALPEGATVTIDETTGAITVKSPTAGTFTIPVLVTYPDTSSETVFAEVNVTAPDADPTIPSITDGTEPPAVVGEKDKPITPVVVPVTNPDNQPVTCTAEGLPAGLTIAYDAEKGGCVISGTPTESTDGEEPIKVIITDDKGNTDDIDGTADITEPAADPTVPSITDGTEPPAVVGEQDEPIEEVIVPVTNPDNQPVTCTAEGLPAGLEIKYDAEKGGCVISGTPTESTDGEKPIKVIITDDKGNTDDIDGTADIKDDADLNTPVGKDQEVKVGETPVAEKSIGNVADLPEGTTFEYKTPVDTSTPGVKDAIVVVTYPDGSSEEVPVKVTVTEGQTQADLNNPGYDEGYGYPGDTVVLPENGDDTLPEGTKFASDNSAVVVNENTGEVTVVIPEDAQPGTTIEGTITVTYPDGSKDEAPVVVHVTDPNAPADWSDKETNKERPVEIPNEGGRLPEGVTIEVEGPGDAEFKDGDTLVVTPSEDAKPGDTITVIVKDGEGNTIDTVTVKIVESDADQNEPVYQDGVVEQGGTIRIPAPKNADGSDLPEGTEFEKGEGAPEWVTVNPDGSITANPGANVPAGEYTFPVVVRYPDGSTDTVNVKVTVTEPAGPAPEKTLAEQNDPKYDLTKVEAGQTGTTNDPIAGNGPSFNEVKIPAEQDGWKFAGETAEGKITATTPTFDELKNKYADLFPGTEGRNFEDVINNAELRKVTNPTINVELVYTDDSVDNTTAAFEILGKDGKPLSDPNGDFDGDGATNREEIEAGTNPFDDSSKPTDHSGVEDTGSSDALKRCFADPSTAWKNPLYWLIPAGILVSVPLPEGVQAQLDGAAARINNQVNKLAGDLGLKNMLPRVDIPAELNINTYLTHDQQRQLLGAAMVIAGIAVTAAYFNSCLNVDGGSSSAS